jgi:hypothetical protein
LPFGVNCFQAVSSLRVGECFRFAGREPEMNRQGVIPDALLNFVLDQLKIRSVAGLGQK